MNLLVGSQHSTNLTITKVRLNILGSMPKPFDIQLERSDWMPSKCVLNCSKCFRVVGIDFAALLPLTFGAHQVLGGGGTFVIGPDLGRKRI